MRLCCQGAFFLPAGYAPEPGDRFSIQSIPPIPTIGFPTLPRKGLTLLYGFYPGNKALMHLEKEMDSRPRGRQQWVYPVNVYLQGGGDHNNNTSVDVLMQSTILYVNKCKATLVDQLDQGYRLFLKKNNIPMRERPSGSRPDITQLSWQPEFLVDFLQENPITRHLEAIIYPVMADDGEEYSFATIVSANAIAAYEAVHCKGVSLDFSLASSTDPVNNSV